MRKCPSCGSLNVTYKYQRKERLTRMGFHRKIPIKVYTCLDCHHTWREQV